MKKRKQSGSNIPTKLIIQKYDSTLNQILVHVRANR